MPQIKDQSDYFNVSLGLRDIFDFGPVLKAGGVEPDDTLLYDVGKIRHVIKSLMGVEPMIVCFVLKDSDVQYLSQMQICVNKEFELVDCEFLAVEQALIEVDNKPQEIQCQPNMPIHYPTIQYAQAAQLFYFNNNNNN